MEPMGELLIVSGPPGSGKSTVAAAIAARREPSVLVEGDAFFRFLRRGRVDPWRAEAHGQNITVGEAAAAATAHFASGPYWTVYDGVVAPWALPAFVAAGTRPIHYVVLLPDVEICVERVLRRGLEEFNDEAAARHMHAQFADTGIAERHLVRDVTDVGALADRILALVATGRAQVEPAAPSGTS
jgi:cytidylate kinase